MRELMALPTKLSGCRNKEQRAAVHAAANRDARFARPSDELRLLDGAVLDGGVIVAVYEFTAARIDPNFGTRVRQVRCIMEMPEATDNMPHSYDAVVSEEHIKA